MKRHWAVLGGLVLLLLPGCTGDEIYKDADSGLMWQVEVKVRGRQKGIFAGDPVVRNMWYEHARDYCASLQLAGFQDWRLPTQLELQQLQVQGTPLGEELTGVVQTVFWSQTPAPSNRWQTVSLLTGDAAAMPPHNHMGVICVRPWQEQ